MAKSIHDSSGLWHKYKGVKVLEHNEGIERHLKKATELFHHTIRQIDLFDSIALLYDQIAQRNGYRAPEILGEMMQPYVDEHDTLIDIGCGTGLSGVPFLGKAGVVDGIDISPRMAYRARQRGYGRVILASATPILWGLKFALDIKEPYTRAISIGLYGDHLASRWMYAAQKVVAGNSYFGLAGFFDREPEGSLEKSLDDTGFKIIEDQTIEKPGTFFETIPRYRFVVAKRNSLDDIRPNLPL